MDPFWLSFRHKDLEDRYQIYHAEHMLGLDIRSSVLSTITYVAVLCKAYEVQAAWSYRNWLWAVLHTLLLAPAPAVWALTQRRSWARRRRLWLTLFVPYSFAMARFVSRTLKFPAISSDAPFLFWTALNLSNIGWQVALSLCYRLPFTNHLPTHTAALAVIQLHNGDWCRWLNSVRPAALRTLRRVAARLDLLGATTSAAAGVDDLVLCRAVLAYAQMYVGLGLGSALVWLLERQRRHTFLLQMNSGTASVTPPPLLRKVGWRALACAVLAAPLGWVVVQLASLLLHHAVAVGAVRKGLSAAGEEL